MEFLLGIVDAAGWLIKWVLPFVVVLSVVVVFHELGHYWVGRLCGVKVDAFSIGFGPELFSLRDRAGTKWRVAALPLGGYVKFFGDMGPASAPDVEALQHLDDAGVRRDEVFHYKPLIQRAAIVAAGPVANFILAILIFAGGVLVVGERVSAPLIASVMEGEPAAEAGFMPGDIILELQGRDIDNFEDVTRVIAASPNVPLSFEVLRGEERLTLSATPRMSQRELEGFGIVEIGFLGVSYDGTYEIRRFGPIQALAKGTGQTVDIVTQTFTYLGRVISGRQSADQLGGPLRIAQVSGQVASYDITKLITLIGILSVSIGLINLFPIPILDGGHLVYYAFEAVLGKPLGEGAQEFGFRIGLVVVLALMVFATWNDLVHLRVFEFLEGMFS